MVGLVVVGLVVAGLGVASATVWRPSDTAVMTTGEQSGATLLTTAPGVLSLVDRDVTITARSSDDAQVVLALGSQVDVEGWVGEDPALRVTGASDWETLTVSKVSSVGSDTPDATDAATDTSADPSTEATAETDAAAPAAPGPDPSGSDMWVESTSGTGTATLDWDATSTDQVLLVAAVGEDAAAPQLTLSWPREVTTPLLWPGVALGVLLVVLGLIYGIVTRGRRRRPVVAPADRADDAVAPTPAGGTPAAGTLTRRQLRELAEKQEAEAAAAAAPRQKRQWPWTGAIPVVKPAEPEDSDKKPAAPEAHRPAWLPEGTGSTSGSSWRAAWGVRAPETGTAGTTPDDAAPGSAADEGSSAPRAAAAGTEFAGRASGAAGGTSVSTPSTPAPKLPTAPSSPTEGGGPTTAASGGGPAATPTTRSAPSAPTTPSGQRPAPQSSKPTSSATSARPPAARPVDPGSPFQRITLRSSDESAPARRIRRDQQQASSAWSASRSPWAQPARPGSDPAGTPRPAPGADGTPSTGSGRTDGTTEPTDDTSKDSD